MLKSGSAIDILRLFRRGPVSVTGNLAVAGRPPDGFGAKGFAAKGLSTKIRV
jgi:hypothetical protein